MVSSEDFIAAALKPESFSNFLAELQQVGFAVVIVIAVREQADFLFSLDFSRYVSEAINSQEVGLDFTDPTTAAGTLETPGITVERQQSAAPPTSLGRDEPGPADAQP